MTSWKRISLYLLPLALTAMPAFGAGDPTVVTLRLPDGTDGAELHGVYNGERDMYEWRGIRFAQPPIESLRWKPPQPITLTGIVPADEFGSACTQPGWDGSKEDCLFLNVSKPAVVTGDGLLPVMVDIHGGGNVYGAGRDDTGGWVKHGVVAVTFNYRLGALGDLGHPALTVEGGGTDEGGTSANYGMRDQIAALKWVKANIASFGGDPDNVTLTGFSSGAGFVIGLEASEMVSEMKLFKRAAPSSFFIGMVTNHGEDLATQEQSGVFVGDSFGCPASAPDVLDCMRGLDATQLANFWANNELGGNAGIVDGVILKRPTIELLQENGSVPTLVGNAREEDGDAFLDPFLAILKSNNDMVLLTKDWVAKGDAAKLRKYYTEEIYGTLWRAFVYFLTDIDNACPTRRVALATGAPTYKYLSTHVLVNDPYYQRALAAHGSDVTLIYDALWYEQTPAEAALSEQMSTYFTNFAKTGNPNLPAVDGLPTWETYEAGTENYMEFADTSIPQTGGYHVAQCDIADGAMVNEKCGNLCHWFNHKNMPATLAKFLGLFHVFLCHDGQTVEVRLNSVERHIADGYLYGRCVVRVDIPGKIEAEDYAYGPEGDAYHDTDGGNNGGAYRFDDVDVRQTGDFQGFQVGWTDPGEWLAYDINVTQSGAYRVTAHITSGCCDNVKSFHLEVDGVDVSGKIEFEWVDTWDELHEVVSPGTFHLDAGPHRLHFVWDDVPFDLESFDLTLATP